MSEERDLKQLGLEISEDMVKSIIKDFVRPSAEKYILASPNKIDDILLPFLDQLEAGLLELADQIDGKEG